MRTQKRSLVQPARRTHSNMWRQADGASASGRQSQNSRTKKGGVNEMRANRHKLLMLHFAAKRNEALESGEAVYLHPHAKKRAQPYACKRPALKWTSFEI